MAILRILAIVFWGLLPAAPTRAAAAPPENVVRAAIVANFINYTEWPDAPSASADYTLCVAGQGTTVDALLALDGKTVYGRRLAVSPRRTPGQLEGCRLLFIGETSARLQEEWLRHLAARPILSVAESEDFLPAGGMVVLGRSGDKVTFDVNLTALRLARLRLDSRLLRLARDLHGN